MYWFGLMLKCLVDIGKFGYLYVFSRLLDLRYGYMCLFDYILFNDVLMLKMVKELFGCVIWYCFVVLRL